MDNKVEDNDSLQRFLLSLFEQGKSPSDPQGCLADRHPDATKPTLSEFLRDPDVKKVAADFIETITQHWERIDRSGVAAPTFEVGETLSATVEPELVNDGTSGPPLLVEGRRESGDELPTVIEVSAPETQTHSAAPKISYESQLIKKERGGDDTDALPKSAPLHLDARPGVLPTVNSARVAPVTPVASIGLPNGRANEHYCGKISGSLGDGQEIQILDVKIPEDIGLEFRLESGELIGTPNKAGEFMLYVKWSCTPGTSHTGVAHLIINPDPRSLWKCIEPPANAPYQKANTDSITLTGAQSRIAAASRRGRSHEHAGLFRDDDFLAITNDKTGWTVLIVADGAGGSKYSREGSRLAVSTMGTILDENLGSEIGKSLEEALENWDRKPESRRLLGETFHSLFHKACKEAVQSIENAAAALKANPRDYSTTLLAAVIRDHGGKTFVATFWLGDGAIVAYGPKGTVRLMGMPDGGEFAGQTRFLDRAEVMGINFAKRVRIGRFEDLTAIILLTDGVSDPFFETDNGLADAVKWDLLWDEIAVALSAPDSGEALLDWLSFFVPGHHDDRTIAVYW